MKKISLNLLAIFLFATLIFACGNTTNNNTSETTEEETTEEEITKEEEETVQTGFNTFEDYAKILSKDALISEFGEENLRDGLQYYAEGTVVVESTTLTNPDNGHVIIYDWDDDYNTSSIKAYYSIEDPETYEDLGTQTIKTEVGLSLGMSLTDLRKWNGANFKFSGFGWDYGGGIYQNEGSKITESDFNISLDILDTEGFDFTIGDIELNADDENLKDAKIIVSELSLYIE